MNTRHLRLVPDPPTAWLSTFEGREPWREAADVVDEFVAGVDALDAALDAELARGRAWLAEIREGLA